VRDAVVAGLRDDEGVLMLGCGERSLRFRPALTVDVETLDHAVDALDRVLARLAR
jgi:L-lysine 6-transaminase